MIYIYDGTINGFLTAFVTAYSDENTFITSKQAQLPLGSPPVFIQTDIARAERAENRLLAFDKECISDLDILLRCGISDSEQVAFQYLRALAKQKRPVRSQMAIPEVFSAIQYIKKVCLEIHKFHGFIRFMETENGVLYAPFSPDNDICDLLTPHFRNRFPQFPFVLHDVKRKKAAIYDCRNSFVMPLEEANVLLSANEADWLALWKEYYQAVNIPQRARPKQMRGYMPVRYWKFLPETQNKE
jgi:probable DNA metabolism protein